MASEIGLEEQRAAFRTTPVVNAFDGKIECLTHYSARVVVGSSDGRLVMFDTRKGPSTSPSCTYTFDHGRPVEQILAVPHIRMVIVVSNGELSAHGAADLKKHDFDFSKANMAQVKLVCINQRGPPHFRLGVALLKRRSIMLYQFHNSDKSYKYLREFPVQHVPESIAWYRNKVIVGYRNEYCILNDKTGESQHINAPGVRDPLAFPIVRLLPKEEVLLTVMDRVGVFVGFNGEPVTKNSITWTNSPSTVAFTSPYILGMAPRVGVEIFNSVDNSLVQSISIPRVSCMFSNGTKWDMEPRPPGDSEDVVVVGVREGSTSSVLKIEQMPLDQQVGELLDHGKIEEAQEIVKTSIAGLTSDKQRVRIKRFQRQAAVALLRRLEFDQASEFMYRGAIEPCELLAFFPEYQCETFAYEPAILKPEVLPRGNSSSPDIAAVIKHTLSTGAMQLASEIARADPDDLVRAATKALAKFLDTYKKHMREKLRTRSRTLSRSRSISSASMMTARDPRRSEAIDNALFRLYVAFHKHKDLLTLIEECALEQDGTRLDFSACEKQLAKQQWFYELGHLYVAQGKFREAVEEFARLHSGEHQQSDLPKKPVDAAVDVLVSAPQHEDELVLEQSVWILRATSVTNALRIFTERRAKIASNDVVEHLKRNSDDPSIVQKYLETLVKTEREQLASISSNATADSLDVNDSYSNFLAADGDDAAPVVHSDTTAEDPHHTRLAIEYLDKVLNLVKAGDAPSKSQPGKEPGPLGDARRRLLRFLRSSSSRYDVLQLMPKIRKTTLYNELVILCGREGLHEEALRALIYELNDLRGAESYASKYGIPRKNARTRTEHNEALLTLLRMCFNPEEDSKKTAFQDFAFQLLARHGKSMDGKAVLEIIPPSTPLNKLVDYFAQCLPHSAHNVRETRITKSLSNIYNLQVQCDRVDKLNQNVQIDPNTKCLACQKRIGDIVFAVYPNGNVLHYNCTGGRLDVCPVTGEKFG